MTPSSLHRWVLAGMVAFLLGAAACAETPEPAQDDSIEATRTRANAGGGLSRMRISLRLWPYGFLMKVRRLQPMDISVTGTSAASRR